MRQIKFREFFNGKFHYWGFVEDGMFKGPVTPSLTRGKHDQYTGLKDLQGNEIYEGDVLTTSNSYLASPDKKLAVKYSGSSFVIYNPNCCDVCKNHSGCIANLDEFGEYQIIGNIYENPELI